MQIQANGITLDYETYGDATNPPLILIRGLSSQRVHWPEQLLKGFAAAGFYTIAFDNRDVGLSQRIDDAPISTEPDAMLERIASGAPLETVYTLHDMARDVTGLMDALGLDKAHVFGISMGGGITQLLTINHPERLLSATIVMTTCRKLEERGQMDVLLPKLVARDYPSLEAAENALLAEYNVWGSPGYPASEDFIRAQAREAYLRGGPAAVGINRQLLATVNAPDTREDLPNVTTPCCVIHGLDDTLIPSHMGEELAAHIPGSELHLIKGMGHIITPQLAPEIIRIVSSFARSAA